ncbi:unnamed protein product, partial [Meganyctiphanes norvegica]
ELTPVSVAAAMGKEAELRMMDKYSTIDLEHKNSDGRTPLNLAAYVGRASMVQLLGYYGNIDIADDVDMTPTHWAVTKVDSSTLLACLTLCPDLTLKDNRNNTALDIAILVGNTEGQDHIENFLSRPPGGCWVGGEEYPAKGYLFFDCKQMQCMCQGWWRQTGVMDP